MTPEECDNLQVGDIFHIHNSDIAYVVVDRKPINGMTCYLLYYPGSTTNSLRPYTDLRDSILLKYGTLPTHAMPKYFQPCKNSKDYIFHDTKSAENILHDIAKRIRAYQFCADL